MTTPVLEYERPKHRPRRRFVWLGITFLGLMALSLFVFLVDTMAIRQSADKHGQIHCASNLRQIGQAIQLYTPDNQGLFPPDAQTIAASPYVSLDCFVCPESSDTKAGNPAELPGHHSYIYVGANLSTRSKPDCIVALEDPANHKLRGGNVLFADYRVEFLDLPTIQLILNELNAGQNPPATLTPTLSRAGAEQDYQQNWKPRMPQLKTGIWRIPTTQPASTPK